MTRAEVEKAWPYSVAFGLLEHASGDPQAPWQTSWRLVEFAMVVFDAEGRAHSPFPPVGSYWFSLN